MEGTIAFLGKGFGFLKITNREKDLFFHAKELIDVNFSDLVVGDTLSFDEIGDSPKGQSALKVRLIKQV